MPKTKVCEEFLGAICIPDVDVLLLEDVGVGAAFHKPEQFFRHASPEHPLRGQQRKLCSMEYGACTHLLSLTFKNSFFGAFFNKICYKREARTCPYMLIIKQRTSGAITIAPNV